MLIHTFPSDAPVKFWVLHRRKFFVNEIEFIVLRKARVFERNVYLETEVDYKVL